MEVDDAPGDAAPFVEPIGEADDAFGVAGSTVIADTTNEISPHAIVGRDGGYLGLGVYHEPPSLTRFGLIGLTADGALDASYGPEGLVLVGPTTDDFGYGAIRLADGSYIVNGDGQTAAASDDFTIGKLDASGALDTSFGNGGFIRVDIEGADRDDTAFRTTPVGSDFVTCGITGYSIPNGNLAMVRYSATGQLVGSFGTAGVMVDDVGDQGRFDVCYDVAPLDDRLIVVAGSGGHFVIAAYDTATGARDSSFATGGVFDAAATNGSAYGIAIDGSTIVAVGENDNAALVVRLSATGTPIATFGNNGQVRIDQLDTLSSVIIQPNGKLVVAGDGDGIAKVARLLSDGTLDASFGTGGIVELAGSAPVDVRHASADAAGRIVIAGIRDTNPPSGVFARIR